MSNTKLPELPGNVSHVMRRIRACESEVPAQIVLEHALHAYAEAAILADRQRQAGEAVAFEFYNPATGHALVDYSRQTHIGPLTKEMGYEARPLGYVTPPPAAVKPGDPVPLWQAREALDSLEESARGDAPYNHFAASLVRTALEQAAIASLPAPQAVQAEPLRVALEELQKLDFDMRVTTSEGLPPEACRIIDTALAAAPSPDGKAEQEEAPSDLSVLRRIHKLLVNQVRPALRSPVITKDVDDAAEALSALMSRTQTEAPSDSTLKLAEMILADCGHSTAISTRLRDRVAERIERHLAAQPTEASCRSTNADGHVLLPFEPTDEMEVAAEDAYEESGSPFPNWKAVYRAMRDAAIRAARARGEKGGA